jgi:hypothetical protein
MDKARRGSSFSRFTVLAIVVGGHVLLVMLFANSRPAETRASSSSGEAQEPLVLLSLVPESESPATAEEPPPEPVMASAGAIFAPEDMRSEIPSAIPDPSAGSSGRASIEELLGDPLIDWEREAQEAAKGMAPGLIRKQLKDCEEAKKHNKYPPGCKKPASAYEPHWQPEEKRAGFAPLPYVRIGKRCVVGLGFFGCTLGKLPDADGSVFENMYDTNRPRSSVPEVEASIWPERPAPLVQKEQ